MEKTPESLTASDLDLGMLSGMWWVPTAEFMWDENMRPAGPPVGKPTAEWNPGDPWLRWASREIRRYAVLRQQRLLDAFAKLAKSPTPARIKVFADRYGWLGRPLPAMAGDPTTPRGAGLTFAEPLSLWKRELAAFRRLYEAREALRVLDQPDSYGDERLREEKRLLDERITWSDDGRAVWYDGGLLAYADGTEKQREAIRSLRPGDSVAAARYAVHEAVSEQLRGHVHPVVRLSGVMRYYPDDLLSAIYLHLALDLTGATLVQRECKNPRCPNGGVFFMKRIDQMCCDKNCREQAGYHLSPNREKGARARWRQRQESALGKESEDGR